MSYILDALKRAEQQRGGAARASGRAPRDVPPERAWRGPWPWIAVAALGVGAVVAAVALWPTSGSPPVATPGAVAGRTAPPEPAVQPGFAPPAPTPARAPSGARPAAAVSRAPEPRVPAPAATERSAISRPARPPAPERDAAGRTAAPAAPPAPLTDPAPPPVRSAPQAEVRLTPRPDEAASAARPAPRVEDTPTAIPPAPRAEVRAATPSTPGAAPPAGGEVKALAANISLQVLSWAPEPKDRFVFLNGRRYVEGQVIDDKLLVERITEDGVVLSYRGERVTLKGR